MKILILESSPLPILSVLGIDINLLLKCSFNITTTILMVYKTLSDETHIQMVPTFRCSRGQHRQGIKLHLLMALKTYSWMRFYRSQLQSLVTGVAPFTFKNMYFKLIFPRSAPQLSKTGTRQPRIYIKQEYKSILIYKKLQY